MNPNSAETVFVGDSEMARLMRSHDWSQTSLGSPEQWPQSLKTTVRIVLTSRQPMFVWWGDQLLNLYNDAYAAFLHTKHPALAQPASQLWYEVWDQLAPRIESARCTNEGTFDEALLFIMERKGYPEETYITFSYSPIPNDEGTIGGILCACNDDTHRIVGERQLALLRELAAKAVDARTFNEACTLSASCLETNPYDLPFALIYLVDSERQCAVLAGNSGIERGHAIAPEAVAFEDDSIWSFAEVVKSQQIGLVADLAARFENLPRGAWDRSPHQAVVVPIAPSGRMGKAGILVVGLNPFRRFDDSYRGFIDLVSAQIAASLANAQVYEEERKRAESLAAEATQQNIETILSSISDAFVVLDQDCRFTYVNDRYCEIVNTEREALLSQIVWERFPEAADSEAERQFERALSQQTPVEFEWLFPAWNRWFEYRIYPSPDGLTIFLTEISDRKQAEAALHQSEAQFRQLADAMPQIVWIADAEGNPEYVSQRWVDYTGLTLEQTIEQSWINQVIHPDDLEPTYEIWRACLATGTLYQTEFRLRQAFAEQPETAYRWFLCRAVPIHNSQGQITHWYGTLTDLHERKQTEMALSQSEGRFRRIFECNMVPMGIWSRSGGVLHANDALLDLIGYTRPELEAGQINWLTLTPPEWLPQDEAALAEIAAKGFSTPFEKEFFHKQGYRVPILIGGASFLDDQGTGIFFAVDLTERKQTEEALRRSEGRQAFLLKFNDTVRPLMDAEEIPYQAACVLGEHLGANRVGYAEDQADGETIVVRRNYTNGVPGVAGRYRYDDYGEGLLREFQAGRMFTRSDIANDPTLTDAEKAAHAVLQVRATMNVPLVKAGRLIAVLFVHYQVAHHWSAEEVSLIQDVADRIWAAVERARAEIALRQSEERYRTLFESIDEGFAILEMLFDENNTPVDYCFLEINPVFEQQTGLQQAVGKTARQLIPGLEDFWIETYGRVALTGEPIRCENCSVPMNRWFDVYACRIGEPEARKVAVVFKDISDRKQAEAEREQLLAREQAAREAAEAASRIKDEFLAVVSHELRSPLNPILGWSKLLRSRQLDAEKTDRALEVIERNAQMQAQLINDLLDVSRILRGKLSLDTKPIDLVATIQAAMETVRLAAEAKLIQIHIQFEPDVGQIAGDEGRLQQVIWNLLTNAIKFTSEGGRVDVSLERVEEGEKGERFTTSLSSSSYAQITVTDTGKGIPPDFLPHVFEQFRQESSATTRRFGGLGLGLAIVRYLVELHGGTIQADSSGEGQGATFTVKLPLMPHQPITQPDPKPSEFSLDLQGTRILVVDDDDNTREFLAFLLELHGANVIATATASEALTTLTQFKPEVLLSDIGMPDVDGYMLMRQVRALPAEQGGTIPAIALTAYAGELDYQQAMAAGFQQHIAKPIDPQVLIQAIASLLEQSTAT